MSAIIAPRIAPAAAAGEPEAIAPEEKLTASATAQPFQDFLDANQAAIRPRAQSGNSQGNQPPSHSKTKAKAPTAPAPIVAPMAAILPAAPVKPAKIAPKPENPAPKENPPPQQAAVAAAAAIAAMQAPPVPGSQQPPVTLAVEAALAATPVQPAATSRPSPTAIPSAPPRPALPPGSPVIATPIATRPAAPIANPPSPAPLTSPSQPASAASQALASVKSNTPGAPLPTLPPPQSANPALPPAKTPLDPSADPAVTAGTATLAPVSSTSTFRATTPPILPIPSARKASGHGSAEIAAIYRATGATTAAGTNSKAQPPGEATLDDLPAPTGTVNAEQVRVMQSAPQLQEETPFTVAASATATSAWEPRLSAIAAAKVIAAQPGSAPRQPGAPSASSAPTPTPAFSISGPAILTARASAATPATPPTAQALASTALSQVMNSAGRMTSDGASQVQLQVNLEGGQQLTVRLQMSQGSVHTFFKTDSPELRQAIEQNWAGFRTSAGERGLQISSPVFESPGAGGGFDASAGRNPSHQPEGDPSEAEGREITTPSGLGAIATSPAATTPAPLAAPATAGSIQLYA